MKNTIVRLLRLKEGYLPQGYDWDNYILSTSNPGLRHDLYHHQPHESGVIDEELRAIGGILYFNEYNIKIAEDTKLLKSVTSFYLDRMRNEAYKYNWKIINGEIERPHSTKKISYLVRNVLQFKYPDYGIAKITEGWEYSKQYSRKAYHKFSKIDFKKLWEQNLDVVINLDDATYLTMPLGR